MSRYKMLFRYSGKGNYMFNKVRLIDFFFIT
jgi:hypothetical protein